MKDTGFEVLTPQGYEETGKFKKMSIVMREDCQRCGNCCKNGGPVLLKNDLQLISNGILDPAHLFTIREGELIKSRQDGEIYTAYMDFIKVTADALGNCIFFDGYNCKIYQTKPKFCTIYKCWSSQDSFIGLQEHALTRQEIFHPILSIVKLIEQHQKICSYDKLQELAKLFVQADESAFNEIVHMLNFDMHCRDFAKTNFQTNDDVLDLMFGRSLFHTIKEFSLQINQQGDTFILTSFQQQDSHNK